MHQISFWMHFFKIKKSRKPWQVERGKGRILSREKASHEFARIFLAQDGLSLNTSGLSRYRVKSNYEYMQYRQDLFS
jgi:hypothetical protein